MSSNKSHSSTPSNALKIGTFTCTWCGLAVSTVTRDGVRRNHCPSCLYSQHVLDHVEGGGSDCHGRMPPIAIAMDRTGAWMVIHRCMRCDELTSNHVCADDNQLILMRTAVRPLAQPPFPLESFSDL
ncbi:RNHCP domain-containing protein [Rhodococcus xishaensis]|uniref:RNHCP domain-containing protein n=1 Tax=Rhodococcus xishaensis TaxID=2487364 RepID=A0A438AVM9_9NOCA|nr:RNHCP domain-containing protein [Rhodococcus xishaensis]RVW02747.1 RNHCP domain-containing protein [Rhodococcus xishaensis]